MTLSFYTGFGVWILVYSGDVEQQSHSMLLWAVHEYALCVKCQCPCRGILTVQDWWDYRHALCYLPIFPWAGWEAGHVRIRLLGKVEQACTDKELQFVVCDVHIILPPCVYKCDKQSPSYVCYLHLFLPTDPTLSLTSLTQLLRNVDWDRLYHCMDIPFFVHASLKSDPAELVKWYLSNHPAPSWEHVADALYLCRQHDVLEELSSQVDYLKGGCCVWLSCICSYHINWEVGEMWDTLTTTTITLTRMCTEG